MQAIATTLAIVLLSSTAAKALPALSSTAAKDVAGGSGFAAELAAATTVDANGDHHLYFRTQYYSWCGEIDAAPYMPAKLFEPRYFLSLLSYAGATLKLFTYDFPAGGRPPSTLLLGKCSVQNFSVYDGTLRDVSWFGTNGTLMGPVCAKQCGCSFEGANGTMGLPPCKDGPDDPSTGSFCSLCGPNTGCPAAGCSNGMIGNANPIHLFTEGAAECQPRGSPCPPPVAATGR